VAGDQHFPLSFLPEKYGTLTLLDLADLSVDKCDTSATHARSGVTLPSSPILCITYVPLALRLRSTATMTNQFHQHKHKLVGMPGPSRVIAVGDEPHNFASSWLFTRG
jgi:hypothetical protein